MNIDIRRPTLVLNKKICLQNIQQMVAKARKNKVTLRPHFKTHQSKEIGRWFREAGINKITVSSLRMAAFFAEDGWTDITVAIPVNLLEVDLINSLASYITLNLLVESEEVVAQLAPQLKYPVNCFIKLDTGYGRTGIPSKKHQEIGQLIHKIRMSSNINFAGFLAHEGHSYAARSKETLKEIHSSNLLEINTISIAIVKDYPDHIRSIGSTPICGGLDNFLGADEVRPGNFVFFDLMQEQIGACTWQEIAVALVCPIIAIHKEKNRVIIHGGGVHFSKDFLTLDDGAICFGQVAQTAEEGWGRPMPGAFVTKLSQEHGTIVGPKEFVENCRVGELLYILPVHSCMTANLMKEYLTTEGQAIGTMF